MSRSRLIFLPPFYSAFSSYSLFSYSNITFSLELHGKFYHYISDFSQVPQLQIYTVDMFFWFSAFKASNYVPS